MDPDAARTAGWPADLLDELLADQAPTLTVAVAAEDLATGARYEHNSAEVFHPASTIKVALLVTLFDRAAEGKLSLDDPLTIHNGFPSSMDGSLFDLAVEDDSETTLYGRMGQAESLRELARLMNVRSSNLATNLLMQVIPPADVTAHMAALGAPSLYLRNRMMDMKAFEARQTNRATAEGLCHLMARIGRRKLPGADEILQILFAQELNEGLPDRLPEGTRVAHKTGSITDHYHDAGVIYPARGRGPFAVAVLTRGPQPEAERQRLVSEIARRLHDAPPA